MVKELNEKENRGIILLKELSSLIPKDASDKYNEALIQKIQDVFYKYKDEFHLSLDISLYESFFDISNGFKKKEMQVFLFDILYKLKRTWLVKDFEGINVWYKIHLDGGGTTFAYVFQKLIREFFPKKKFFKTLEWCSGPGFIGFQLLGNNVTEYLRLTDFNEEAVACAQRTISENKLEKTTKVYYGDNLSAIPEGEKFDLVVACPPWAYQINNNINPMISSDVDWNLHEAFYKQIKSFLFPGAIICLNCFEPFEKKPMVHYQDTPYDVRPEEPILSFKRMIEQGGLVLRHIYKPEYVSKAHMGYGVYFIFCEYLG